MSQRGGGGQKDVKSVFAHVFGLGDLTYHPNGREIFTCGADAAIRIFPHDDIDAKPKEITYHKGGVTCITFNSQGDCFAAGDEEHVVALYTYPDCKFDQVATRCTTAITHLTFSPSGNLLAVAEQDTNIKLVSVLNTQHVTLLKGHTGPIRSLAFDPLNEYLASSAGDGTLRVWKIRDKSTVIAIPCFPTTSADSLQLLRMCWSPEGGQLAIPGDKSVKILNRNEWRGDAGFPGHSANTTIASFSPNGKYIATTGEDNKVNVYDCKKSELIGYIQIDTQCTGLSWATKSNTLVVLERFGNMKQWNNPVPEHMPKPYDEVVVNAKGESSLNDNQIEEKKSSTEEKEGQNFPKLKSLDENDDDDDDDDDDEDDNKSTGSGSPGQKKKRKRLRRIADDDEDEEDSKKAAKRSSFGSPSSDNEENSNPETPVNTKFQAAHNSSYLTPSQPSFQPSATPLGLQRRYLAWNAIGIIVSRQEHTHSAIQIDFHDAQLHRSVRFLDRYNYVVAALSSTAAIFASSNNESGPSTIFYKPFETWGNKSEWLFQLEDDEEVKCCAIGKRWAAVGTSENFLRIFSYSGLQIGAKSLPGPVVAMTGNDDHLAVVFSVYGALQYWLLDVSKDKFISQGMLPISPGSTLSWLGFTWNLNNLATFDSKGVLRMLVSKDFSWIPILNAKKHCKGRKDTVWPIYTTSENLMCHICKGGKNFPQTLPRPIPQALPICVPILGLASSESEKLQEKYLRQKMILEEHAKQGMPMTPKDKIKLDKLILMNIRLACKGGRSVRALDLSTRLNRKKSLDTAILMANRMNQTQLVERMSIIMQGREAISRAATTQRPASTFIGDKGTKSAKAQQRTS